MVEYRGFSTKDEMNSHLIQNINAVVRPGDRLYILGDVTFGNLERSLMWLGGILCKDIHLIPGNHDSKKLISAWEGLGLFVVHGKIHNVKWSLGNKEYWRAVLSHFPILQWDRAQYGIPHLHGHSHGNLRFPGANARILDVGVDNHPDMRPFSLAEVEAYMKDRKYVSFDHHKDNTG